MFRNRWVRRVGLGLLATFLLVVSGFFVLRYNMHRKGVHRLETITAHLDATDPRWRYDDLDADRGQMPDDQNGALLVPRFKAALGLTRIDASRPDKSGLYDGIRPNHELDDEGAAALDRALDGNGAALAVALSFRDRPRGVRRYVLKPDVIGTLMLDVQDTRQMATALDLEAEWLARDGRHGSALQLIPIMLNAARSIDAEPFIISTLVRSGIDNVTVRRVERALALGVPKGGLAEVQTALLREADADVCWVGLRGERATMDRLFTNIETGALPPDFVARFVIGIGGRTSASSMISRAHAWAHEPYFPTDHATYLETVTRAMEVRRLPEHQQRAAMSHIPKPANKRWEVLTREVLPAFERLHEMSLRHKANLRCAGVAVAVERFRQLNGRWPDALEEIPSDILATVPLDPFDGQPLRYLRREDGVTVYSIGQDEVDNGGNVPDKFADQLVAGYDIGCRLYDVHHRGRPALPRFNLLLDLDPPIPLWSPFLSDDERERITPIAPDPREIAGPDGP